MCTRRVKGKTATRKKALTMCNFTGHGAADTKPMSGCNVTIDHKYGAADAAYHDDPNV
jgi:hypothetical protein